MHIENIDQNFLNSAGAEDGIIWTSVFEQPFSIGDFP
ncbi:MAG: hypothetical protein BWY31_00599 [Lentisphaerae bacterium ADurb.Bin242]|nr:MAG: hypothetical protein BWY31_00599 [Lentisphaerae bacterium ADurb.Bin242]